MKKWDNSNNSNNNNISIHNNSSCNNDLVILRIWLCIKLAHSYLDTLGTNNSLSFFHMFQSAYVALLKKVHNGNSKREFLDIDSSASMRLCRHVLLINTCTYTSACIKSTVKCVCSSYIIQIHACLVCCKIAWCAAHFSLTTDLFSVEPQWKRIKACLLSHH